MPILHCFRRDLRLLDNTAFNRAMLASGGQVIPVFVLDDALLFGRDSAPARVAFLLDCLRDLDAQLRQRGGYLVLRRGDTAQVLQALIRETGATTLTFNRDYTPAARRRDSTLYASLKSDGVEVLGFKDQVHFEENDILTGGGTPYTVFTPYKRAWLAKPRPQPQDVMDAQLRATLPPSLPIPDLAALGVTLTQTVTAGGERHALQQLQRFVSGPIADYDTARDVLAAEGTSRLSPHLRFGTLSPRVCVAAAEGAKTELSPDKHSGPDTWISELIWREFYQQVLFHHPHADKGNFKRDYDRLRWGSGDIGRDSDLFAAWCEGRTGFPVVDAAMRQLAQTAWMHNRARMIVASFFTKDLLLDWRMGESYFMRMLVDGDPASNNGGWQWAASTGTDAQPYFRVFNPRLQGERFDPDGAYVRRYVPELARVPADAIHAPSEMKPLAALAAGFTPGETYPLPIVDHATQKAEILARFKAL
jgi:deoxyribodipyrimidine photo-lyase